MHAIWGAIPAEGRRVPGDDFHWVFTLDHRINPLALGKLRLIYGLLFRCAADTLLAFARNPKWLGATPGILMVPHTWGQTLDLHSHVHRIVTGGGLTEDGLWRAARPHFLLPVPALSRGKVLEVLRQALTRGEVRLPDGETEPKAIQSFIDTCQQSDWVVYAKSSFDHPDAVLDDLCR
jgi:hypothetical protein